ncbi:DUF2267 domain-containing protein [Actinacidiphila glaucinigra]|uniref:Uncharacterized conserved protein, DUF2267 family n=1 Tax=Actinacidiphila glaucinigra TaxID=235986 RepID=A0A239LV57_9ACTN|nr:DUF2267 domain-containing protein [Actinacidiphila glaucinigra]SNT33683.1 Uncharacterized conserved protein, DUF2267 family [Actinacidiphila glaucinigra]
MYAQRQAAAPVSAMTFEAMVEQVRYDGAYPTHDRAEQAVRHVMAGLGRQLIGDERVALAARLPLEAALELTAQVPRTEPLTGFDFVSDLAARTGGTPATARWDAGIVFAVLRRLTGDDLISSVLAQLPSGYALLFGRAELAPTG